MAWIKLLQNSRGWLILIAILLIVTVVYIVVVSTRQSRPMPITSKTATALLLLNTSDNMPKALLIFGSQESSAVAGRVFMTSGVPPANWQTITALDKSVLAGFPGYLPVATVVVDENDVIAEHEQLSCAFMDRAKQSSQSLVYGKIRGQVDGLAGMLFIDGGLGWPRSEFTPSGIICHDWTNLHELMNRAEGKVWLHILRGSESHEGSYAVAGFEADEFPGALSRYTTK